MENVKRFNSFAEFYPYYLAEHANSTCRRLHFIGTTLGDRHFGLCHWQRFVRPTAGRADCRLQLCLDRTLLLRKNGPATFQHPFYSLLGDFVMYRDMILGKVPF